MARPCPRTYDPVWNFGSQNLNDGNIKMVPKIPSVYQEPDERSTDTDKAEIFHNAVRRGDVNLVRLLHIHYEVGVNSPIGNKGEEALHIACKRGHKELVNYLLHEAKVDVERTGNFIWNRRAIHCAALGCHPEILKLLIQKGAQLDSQNVFQETAIHITIIRGYSECSRLLIQSGCNLSLQDWSGNTALHYAIRNNAALDIIQLLVSKLGSNLETKNEHGQTALLMACHQKNYAVIELLVEAGADLQAVDKDGNTALILAVSNAYYDVVQSVPLKELSPSIFQFYQNPGDEKLEQVMRMGPIMSLFCYLIYRGCCWNSANFAGKKAADVLREEHCPSFAIKVLDRMAAKWEREAQQSIDNVCPCGCGALDQDYFGQSSPSILNQDSVPSTLESDAESYLFSQLISPDLATLVDDELDFLMGEPPSSKDQDQNSSLSTAEMIPPHPATLEIERLPQPPNSIPTHPPTTVEILIDPSSIKLHEDHEFSLSAQFSTADPAETKPLHPAILENELFPSCDPAKWKKTSSSDSSSTRMITLHPALDDSLKRKKKRKKRSPRAPRFTGENGVVKRSEHLTKERIRRTDLKMALQSLRSLLPDLEGKDRGRGVTKQMTLDNAIICCQTLTAQEKQHLADIVSLENQQRVLRERMDALLQREC